MSAISQRLAGMSSMRLALLAEQLRSECELLNAEPVAVIGMGCRLPGGRNDLDSSWQRLRDGVDTITEVPPERWDIEAYYDPDPDASGKMSTRWGGFLDRVDNFDAGFFGIAPREAVSTDPQQRLLLEVTWEALESAGQVPAKLAHSQTAVFIGICSTDYFTRQLKRNDPGSVEAYWGTGNAESVAAGRLSYVLGLQGPSVAIDTACSSSLVAIHYACQGLRVGECDLALAGGVSVILNPETTIIFSKARMMAPDGRCKTFDRAADGYVRGEGCGVLVLKRLSDALRDGDNILAVIRGSAVNQDGPSGGLTVPNGPAQEAVIRRALANAGVDPGQVDYVEAHGTGTALGDPIEVQALGDVFGEGHSKQDPLIIGSVKTNIGHLEGAAGVAGVIKVVLALQHEEIPPHLHFKEPNPHIAWDKLAVKVATEPIPWPSGQGRRIAGVSSFGFSGTNAHVVVEEAPVRKQAEVTVERPLQLLSLSAKSEEALRELAGRFGEHLARHPELTLGDVCYTANAGRSHFPCRMTMLASSPEQLGGKLTAYATGERAVGVVSGKAGKKSSSKMVFLFTGQGSQYIGMGSAVV